MEDEVAYIALIEVSAYTPSSEFENLPHLLEFYTIADSHICIIVRHHYPYLWKVDLTTEPIGL